LSTNATESEDIPSSAGPRGFRLAAPLVPMAAALLALAVHLLLPDRLAPSMGWLEAVPAWRRPYPLALLAVLVGLAAWAAYRLAWRPLGRRPPGDAPLATVAAVVGCAWDLATAKWGWLPYPYFPGPGEVFGALVEDRGVLFESAWHSLRLLGSGYFAGAGFGLVAGTLIGWFPVVRHWGMPLLKLVGPVPATALVPLAMTLFPASLSFFSGTALIAFAVWFPMTMLTASGIANVRLAYLDVARTLGAGRLYLIFRVAIPSAMPNIFLGLFQGLGASFLTLVVAETVGVKAGLGWYLQWQKGYAEYGKVYAALFIMAIFFSAITTLLFKVRDRVLRWQRGVLKW
jgi:NitT/TauT family transport system permease protein